MTQIGSRFRLNPFLTWSFALLCLAGTSHAATMSGRVRSREGRDPIAGATILLVGTPYGCVSDSEGYFTLPKIPAGQYTLRVSMLGFQNYQKTGLELDDDSEQKALDVLLREKPITFAETVVEARADKELESSARLSEKESNSIINIIPAQTIERSTDRTAADALQRVSGMSLIRDQGEGRYVVMRGLEQRYNNTLVDGVKIPSPESKDRFVPLDIFPAAMFGRIEVTKALTPDLAGDAIGGSTDLMLRDAPLRPVFSFSAATGSTSGVMNGSFSTFDRSTVPELDPDRLHGSVSDADPTTQLKPRYNPTSADFTVKNLEFTNKKPPLDGLYSLVAGDRILDDKVGIIASGSYQYTSNEVKTDFYSVGSNINAVDAEGHLIPYAATYDDRNYFTTKMRGGAAIKTDFIAASDQQIEASYIYVRQEEAQVRHAVQVQIDGERGAADLTYTDRSALRIQDISSITVKGSHFTESPLAVQWDFNFTDAVQDRPDEAEYSVFQNFDPYGHLQPFQGLDNITHVWRKNDDRQYLGKLDADLHITDDGMHVVQAGAVVQKLNRVNFQNDYKLNPAIINGRTQAFTSIDSAITVPFGFGSTSGTSVYGYQNYKADEILYGSFVQYTAIFGALQVLGGVRWEQARDTYFTMAPVSVGENQANVTTVDFLPGIHFRYAFTPEQIGRISLTRTMSRPSYFDLVPAYDRSDNSQSQGNPNLRPAHSTNFDLRYEFYPNASDLYSLGFYYKRITDPVEDQYSSVGVVLVTTKGNGDPATVYGCEAVVSKKFAALGISANYSYAFSQITNTKLVPHLDANGDPVIPVPSYQQKRPLQSQSPHVFNATVSYENEDWGTEAGFSYNYTGRRLLAVALIDGYDTYQDGVGELDFSGEQKIAAGFSATVKLINLLNASTVTEVASGDYIKHNPIVIERDLNKFRGAIGVSFKL